MRRTLSLVLGVLLSSLTAGMANASDVRISVQSGETITPFVELYTSEGCSSCPPADRLLTRLGKSEVESFDLVPLAFHVDYWNWLGWPDPYSQAKFTTRQREVAANNRQRSIYTPELVVAGQEARGGDRVYALIDQYNRTPAEVSIKLSLETRAENSLQAELEIDNGSERRAELFLAVYENDITREIGGGENAGKTLMHDFVVRHWSQPKSLAPGPKTYSLDLPLEADWDAGNLGVAVIVVDRDNGDTLQAINTGLASLFDTAEPDSSAN